MGKNDPRLTAYVLGELEGKDCADLEAEIAASPELQREVVEIRRTTESLFDTFGKDLEEVNHPQLKNVLTRKTDAKRSRFFFWAAAASITFLACSLAMVLWQHQASDRTAKNERSDLMLPDICLLYTSPSPRDATLSRMPSSA